jgi:hypothetical protein
MEQDIERDNLGLSGVAPGVEVKVQLKQGQ